MVLDGNMASQLSSIGNDDVVRKLAVVAEVRKGHDEIVVSHAGRAATFGRAEADADVFTDSIVVTNDELGCGIGEAVVLCRAPEHGTVLNQVICPDSDSSVFATDSYMRLNDRARANLDACVNDAKGSDLRSGCDIGVGGNYGRGMDTQN